LFFVPLYLAFGFIIKKEYFRGWLYILTNGLGLIENYYGRKLEGLEC
jgi:hypothetical protein